MDSFRMFDRQPSRPAQGAGDPVDAVPDWASTLSVEQYRAFIACVRAELDARRMRYEVHDGMVFIDLGGEQPWQVGLQNLLQTCGHGEASDWPAIVKGHFDAMLSHADEEAELRRLMGDLERIRHRLVPRLWPAEGVEGAIFERAVLRPDLPGTYTMLMFDLPTSMRTVTVVEADVWDLSHDELFGIALENVWAAECPGWQTIEHEGGASVRLLVGDSFTTSSHALLLDRHEGVAGPYGTLVAVPNRHAVLCHPVASLAALAALQPLALGAMAMHERGPGSICPTVYWRRGGRFEPIEIAVEGGRLSVRPSETIAGWLNELPDPPENV